MEDKHRYPLLFQLPIPSASKKLTCSNYSGWARMRHFSNVSYDYKWCLFERFSSVCEQSKYETGINNVETNTFLFQAGGFSSIIDAYATKREVRFWIAVVSACSAGAAVDATRPAGSARPSGLK